MTDVNESVREEVGLIDEFASSYYHILLFLDPVHPLRDIFSSCSFHHFGVFLDPVHPSFRDIFRSCSCIILLF